MSAVTVVMIAESILLAAVLVFLVAVLRSHAEILGRLGALESRGAGQAAQRPDQRPVAGPAPDIAGETLSGDAVKLTLGAGSPRTLLSFLSTGCAACGPLWEGLHDRHAGPMGARLVIVTKGPERESLHRLQGIAPPGHEILMSSAAWEDYAVPASPHFVLVDSAAGGILGQGSATSWEQIETLLVDAQADSELHRARTTSERAARAEHALATAGISRGHPSLYPSRPEPSDGQP